MVTKSECGTGLGWIFAATHDAGKNWTVWNGCDKAAELKMCNYEGIKTVDLSATGTGSMTVNPIPDQTPFRVLHTDDFGGTWHE